MFERKETIVREKKEVDVLSASLTKHLGAAAGTEQEE